MPTVFDARIEDGKLFYDKKWFHRGQNVLLESNEAKFNAILVQIGSAEVCFFCEAFFICIKSKQFYIK
jgi:hypothetical protein